MCCCMNQTSSVPPWKSLEMAEKCSKTFIFPLEQFWKMFEKSSKTSSLVCLCNKQNITCPLVDMNFIFSCSTRHLTHSLPSLVIYRVQHSKINFIYTRGHVISSVYFCFCLPVVKQSLVLCLVYPCDITT